MCRRTNVALEPQPGSRANHRRQPWWEGYAAASEVPLLGDCEGLGHGAFYLGSLS